MRTLSSAAQGAVFAAQTGQAFILYIKIDHADLPAPIRVNSDAVVYVRDGENWHPFPFAVAMPPERDDRLAGVQLIIDNIDRSIVNAVRSVSSAPTITLEVAMGSSPETLEAGPFVYTLKNAKWDAHTVEGDLAFEDILNEAFPGGSFTPQTHQGLFG